MTFTPKGFSSFNLKRVCDNLKSTFKSDVLERTLGPAGSQAQAEAPVRTGNLRSKTGHRIIDDTRGQLYSETPYSVYVNFGTSRMSPRPFFSNAVAQLERDLHTQTQNWVKNALRR